MKKIFIGLIFIFSSFGVFTVNYLPSFVGYILIFLGLDEEYECPSLTGSRAICVGAAVIMAVIWGAGLFGYGFAAAAFVNATMQLLVTFRLVMWAEQQGEELGWTPVELRPFRVAWYALAGAAIAAVVLRQVSVVLGLVWAVVAIAADVWFIIRYFKLWKAAVPAEDEGE